MLTRTIAGRTFTYSRCLGRGAASGEGFQNPVDIALGSNNMMYVLNRPDERNPNTRIGKFDLGNNPGDEQYLMEWGTRGDEDGQFMAVTSMVMDKNENLYVADELLNRISIFDTEGNFLSKWGASGSGDGELDRPWGLALDNDENLYVVDMGNSRVQKFSKDGQYLGVKWGEEGTGEGQFNMPWGISVDAEGSVYVADWYNARVQKFTADGRYLMSFGAPGSGDGEVRRPSDVAVDAEGDVFVVDWGNSKVQVFDEFGDHITTFEGDAQQLTKWGQRVVDANPDYQKARRRVRSLEPEWRFYYPSSIALDDKGRIAVAEVMRNRVQIYVKEQGYVDPQFNL
jgi:DNA-binding beta-propeller fold protein YncE